MQFLLPQKVEILKTDTLVVGSGIAGLTVAVELKEKAPDMDLLLVSRGEGNSPLAQGGIAAVISPEDSPYAHFLDTLKAGRYINDEEAVRVATYRGKSAISKLLSWGVKFDKGSSFWELTLEAAHSKRRILKVKDYTGRAIHEALKGKIKSLNIPTLKGELIEIYTSEGKVAGDLLLTEEGFKFVKDKFLVLATGGAAGLYAKTSNRFVSGDILGAALRAGALLRDSEFVQFHPTVLRGTNYLLTEALRGEGAILINSEGERFVNELGPRDEVSRAIFFQLREGKEVFLDLRPLIDRGIRLEEKFPQVYQFLVEKGFDPYKEPVPVEPAAHYFIGGIATDIDGKTSIENLYAVGECANTGLHGANRLASNSLLENVVFGSRAAEDILINLPFAKFSSFEPPKGQVEISAPFNVEEKITLLRSTLWNYVGIVRKGEELKEALKIFDNLLEELKPLVNRNVEVKKLFDLTLVAKAITLGALKRKESRGCHYRLDYPAEREPFRKIRFAFSLKDLLVSL